MKKVYISLIICSILLMGCDFPKPPNEKYLGEKRYKVTLYIAENKSETIIIDNYLRASQNEIFYYIDGKEYIYNGSYKIEEGEK